MATARPRCAPCASTHRSRIDGALDEALYRDVAPMSDFIQIEPDDGAPATEQTEVWIAFDDDNVYVSFRCWDSDPDRLVANEMRRDNGIIWSGNDNVAFIFDTFYDRATAFQFTVNPHRRPRRTDRSTNERQFNGDWNPVWDLETGRFEGGWTVESGDPVQVAALPAGHEPDLGLQRHRAQPLEERDRRS